MARGNTGIARALCLAILCVLLPGPSLSGTAQNEPIVFLGDHNFPPYKFLDAGTPRGASVNLLNAIGEVLERLIENDISGIQALPRPFAVKIAGISIPKTTKPWRGRPRTV